MFVDATLRPLTGQSPLVPEQFVEVLTALAQDGILPIWSEWFEPGTIESLIPDPTRRDTVVTELPRLPLAYFRDHVPVPEEWDRVSRTYVLLSDPYRSEADQAAARGWPVIELLGSHLDLVTQPGRLATALHQCAHGSS